MGSLMLDYTRHAVHAMEERLIPREWVESTVAEPYLHTSDPNDPDIERFFRLIPATALYVLPSTPRLHPGAW